MLILQCCWSCGSIDIQDAAVDIEGDIHNDGAWHVNFAESFQEVSIVQGSDVVNNSFDVVQSSQSPVQQTTSVEQNAHLYFKHIIVEFGVNIGKHVKKRILTHLGHVQGLDSIDHFRSITSHQEEILMKNKEKLELENPAISNGETDNRKLSFGKTLLLSFGNASLCNSIMNQTHLNSLRPESFYTILTKLPSYGEDTYALVTNGLPLDSHTRTNISFDRHYIHYGAVVGSYATLELLGFAFLHPLEPYIPPSIRISKEELLAGTIILGDNSEILRFSVQESPHWPERSFHLHTQHPLELTEVLQGHDIPRLGPYGPLCSHYAKRHYKAHKEGSAMPKNFTVPYCERWDDMVIDVDYFFEWSVANRLNKVEWLLLHNFKWGYEELESRFYRLKKLTFLGHQYSLLIGADVPVGNKQQHGWYMVNVRLPIGEQKQQIRDRVDWIFKANFDVISTESGLSEFTHPECDLMLELLNEFATYANVTWGREAGVKVHCSTGQRCSNFLDPRTGDPVNFNFLPTFAHPSLTVFPHTVQVYAFDDPTAGTYGNKNFKYVEDYLVYEAKQGKRGVLFYGETSYWVNYDIDVPLFIPLYGQRRQKDLRKIGLREIDENFRMHGQMNFDSGWEWGYWLNDVVTARSSWDPLITKTSIADYKECTPQQIHNIKAHAPSEAEMKSGVNIEDDEDEEDSLMEDKPSLFHEEPILSSGREYEFPITDTKIPSKKTDAFQCPPHSDEWEVYRKSIRVFSRLFDADAKNMFGQRIADLVIDLSQKQVDLLVNGKIHGRESPNLKKLSGIAYLCGTDTWVDIPRLFGLSFTQPDKVHLNEVDDPDWPYVIELLSEMDRTFGGIALRMNSLYNEIFEYSLTSKPNFFVINRQAMTFLEEIKDSINMLALRSKQVKLIYESRDPQVESEEHLRKRLQLEGRNAIEDATKIVRSREEHYRVHWRRIASWRENPTVYRYGYLWSVHSLYNWWRDQGIAEKISYRSEFSPCYLNRMDSTEVAVGWGKYTLELLRNFVVDYTPFASWYPLEIVNCLAPSTRGEYEFPRDL